MITLTLEQVADVVGGDLLDTAAAERVVDRVTVDSRDAGPGALFVALPGTRTDGHRFVDAALAAGAGGAIVSADRLDDIAGDTAAVVVDDPADALLALGVWVRDTVDPLVVAITGSNGKTTTKDLIAAANGGRRVVANRGSFNNELGVPLTCCRLEEGTEILVCELGMRGSGQIAELAGLLRPTIGVVTSVAAVHLELLGSLEAIADAKAELVEALPPDGVAVLSADDPLVAAMATRTEARVVTFGQSASAQWRARDIAFDDAARATFTLDSPAGSTSVRVPVAGLHNVGNALAALAAAVESGTDLDDAVAGLAQATVSPWRLQLEHVAGVRVLNDAYNANPTSVIAALRTLVHLPIAGEGERERAGGWGSGGEGERERAGGRGSGGEGERQRAGGWGSGGRRLAVLGTMAEIGATSEAEHRRVGEAVAEVGIDVLIAVGPQAAAIHAGADAADPAGAAGRHTVDDVEEAARLLASQVRNGDVVLVKASRSAALEGVVTRLEELLTKADAAGDDTP